MIRIHDLALPRRAACAGALVAACLLAGSATAQIMITSTTNNGDVLRDALLGPGITPVGSAVYIGGEMSTGFFTGGATSIGISEGILLTTGDANSALGPNFPDDDTDPENQTIEDVSGFSSGAASAALDNEFGLVADPKIGISATADTTSLQFDFTTTSGDLFFNYVFASEEYNEFANSEYNDVFAFFVDGVNVAVLPGTSTPVSINTVNGGYPFGNEAVNPQFFNNNDPSDGGGWLDELQYDGFTDVFTAAATDLGPGTHTIEIAISDVGDDLFDSAVFLELSAFVDQSPANPSFDGDDDVNVLHVDFGQLTPGAAPDPAMLSVHNLPTGPNTAIITLGDVMAAGDSDVLGISGLEPFEGLFPGGSQSFTADVLDTTTPGSFAATYSLIFVDELGGERTLTLELTAEVAPEPMTSSLVALAACGALVWARPRSTPP